MKFFLKNKKTIFTKDIINKAVVLMIATIFLIGAFIPAANSQVGRIVDDQLFEESEEIVTRDSDYGSDLYQKNNQNPSPLGVGDPWWNTAWLYRKEITVNHSRVVANLTNFPMLISLASDDDLADGLKCQDDGDDIVFTDVSGTQLNHEIEFFNNSSGNFIAWVNVSSLSSTVDTTLYLYYGNPDCDSQENPSGVWDSSYRGVWHLNEISGTVFDSTGYGNDGTPYGVNQSAEGIIDGADSFDGDDYVNVNDDSSLDVVNVTVETWVNSTGSEAVLSVVAKDYLGGSVPFKLDIGSGDNNGFGFFDGSWHSTNIAGNETDGSWHHIVGTYDGSALRYYVDGSLVDTVIYSGSLIPNNAPIYIGRYQIYYFNGIIDEVRVSNPVRNASWISTEYRNQRDPDGFYSIDSEIRNGYPVVSNPSPNEGATSVSISLPELSFTLTDFQNDSMNYTVETVPDIDGGSGTGVLNGTYNVSVSGLNYNATYTWFVNVTDGTHWTNRTFNFITEEEPITDPFAQGWQYRKEIVINHSMVASDLSGFPVLVSISGDGDLVAHAQSDGDDIVFMDGGGVSLQLAHEFEYYNGSSGDLIAWVNVSSLSSAENTSLYMYYGNLGCDNQENPSGVWGSSYRGVWHLSEVSGTVLDSSLYGNDGTPYGVDQDVIGLVDGADYFNRTDQDYIDFSDNASLNPTSELLLEAWAKFDDVTSSVPQTLIGKLYTNYELTVHFDTSPMAFALYKYRSTGSYWENIIYYFDTDELTAGSWHYFAASISGNTMKLYFDGELKGTKYGEYSGTQANVNHLNIGKRSGGSSHYIGGVMDEVRLSSNSRNDSWIQTVFNNLNNSAGFYFVGLEVNNAAPIVYNPSLANGATNVNVSLSELSFNLSDYQDDSMDYTVETSPDIGSGSGSGVYNGRYNISLTELDHGTVYNWYVNVTDPLGSGNWTNETFSFTTEMPPLIHRFTVDNDSHVLYGLVYPVTYVFDIPSNATDLKVYKFVDVWTEIPNKSSSDLYSGVEAARFNYSEDKAYISVSFPADSDSCYIKITDTSDNIVMTEFVGISQYYDDRKAVVIITGDDWDSGRHERFMDACDACQLRNIWFSPGINSRGIAQYYSGSPNWTGIQTQVDEGFVEPSSHGRNHFHVPYNTEQWGRTSSYDGEIGGCMQDILENITMPALNRKGSEEFMYAWLEPYGEWDSTVSQKLGEYHYLSDRSTSGGTVFASWRSSDEVYDRAGVAIWADGRTTAELNSRFDTVYNEGGIHHVACHPGGHNWQSGPIAGHLEYLANRSDVWYVGFGHLYVYHYMQERNVISHTAFSGIGNILPILSRESPSDGSVNVTSGIIDLKVRVDDLNENLMNVTFMTNASGSWAIVGSNISVSSGVYRQGYTFPGFNTSYWWSVKCTDGTGWTNDTYGFTTGSNLPPVLSSEYPSDGAARVYMGNIGLQIHVYDINENLMNVTFMTNASGSWAIVGSNISVSNGIYQQGYTFPGFNTSYWWSVNCTDGTGWTNDTYVFTTRSENYLPVISNPSPTDDEMSVFTGVIDLYIMVNDSDSDLMNITFRTNASGFWSDIGTNSSQLNGTYMQRYAFTGYNNSYWWSVNCTDGIGWTNATYGFTTHGEPGPWWNNDWLYRKGILISHLVIDGNLSDFPVLISFSIDTDLAVHAQSDGDDLVFTDYDGNKLHHEIEDYNGTSGLLVAWVNVSSLSSTVDTTLYLYYGNPDCDSQENPSGVWDSSYRGVWHLNEISGTVFDSTGYGNDGTPYGVNQSAEGIIDGADSFDGDDYVNVNDDSSLDVVNVTVEAWVKSNVWVSEMPVLSKDYAGGSVPFRLDIGSGGNNGFGFFDGSWHSTNIAGNETDGSWHHIVGTYDGSALRYYVDGSLVDTVIYSGVITQNDASVFIGRYQTYYLDGIIDEVRVSNPVRNASWISTEYRNQRDPDGFYSISSEKSSGSPVVSDPYPNDGATSVSISLPELSFTLTDFQNDSMVYTVETRPDVGSGNGSGVYNGRYNTTLTGLGYGTVYTWYVNVTDPLGSGNWTNETYGFTTGSNLPPVLSSEYPSDGSTHVPVTISSLNVTMEDPEGDSFDWTIETSTYIGSNSGTGEYNDTKTCTVVSALNYDTTYTWYVNATDSGSGESTNKIYDFTTEPTSGDWGYFKKITIDHTEIDTDLTNFPILFHNTTSDFINHAQSDGDDFVFMDSANVTQYNHEIEKFDNTTGELIAWVNITKLSSTEDTIIWLNYGNLTTSSQENVHGVWDRNYHGVYHMNDKNSTIMDSSSNKNHGSLYGNYNSISGNIGDAIHFEGDSGDYGLLPSTDDGNRLTALCWFNYVSRNGLHTQDWILSNARGTSGGWRCYSRDGDGLFFYKVYYEGGGFFNDFNTNPWGYTTTGQWYFTALSYENGGLAFDMINDNIIGTHSPTDLYDDYHDDISLASNRVGRAYCSDSIIDEVRISIYPRNISWLKTTYNTTYHQDTFLSVSSEKTHLPPIDTTPPVITNVDAQPNPQYEGGYVNITCDVTDNVGVNNVKVNITNPLGSSINVTMENGSYYYNTIFTTVGTYSHFIWANDTSNNSKTSSTYTFTILENTQPVITNVMDSPDPQEVYGYVNLSCDVTDNVAVDEVRVNITYPDSSSINISMGGSYYYNTTYTMLGTYSYFIWAIDTSGNSNISAIYSFLIEDSELPIISNVMDTPDPQEVYGYVNISCDVTDNVVVDEVRVNITYPDSSSINMPMGGSYYYNTTYTMLGTYSYFIWANDTSGNTNTSSTYTFVIIGTALVYVDDDFTLSTPGWNITHFDNIQDGIDAAIENGTVYVYNGTYIENVVVDKTISLIGEDRDGTIITCVGTYDEIGITIQAKSVDVNGFTIENTWSYGHTGVRVYSNNTTISNNIFIGNGDDGITVFGNNTMISGNIFEDNADGIGIGTYCSNTTVYGNTISNSTDDGIYGGNNNTIVGNIISNNADHGMYLSGKINNTILDNTFSNNNYGIYLTGSTDNIVYNNRFNNSNNAYDDGSNTWNISKILGTNIIGGSYLGGNYWSDYMGIDSDGDGLGDTPYNIPGGSNQDLYPLVYLATTLRLVPENTTTLGYTNITFELLLEHLQNGLSGYNITISISNSSVGSIISVDFPPWAVLNDNSSLPSNIMWIKALDLTDQIKGEVANVSLANITIKALNTGKTYINISINRLDNDDGLQIMVIIQNSTLTVLYALPPLPEHHNPPTDPDSDGLFEDLNGNGLIDFDDVVQFFQYFEWIETNYPTSIVDFNGNAVIDYNDIITMFKEV